MKYSKLIIISLVSVSLAFSACHRGNTIFDEQRTFEHDVWNHFKPEEFNIDVANEMDYYNIDITVCVDTAIYRYNDFPCMAILKSPSGEIRQFYHTVSLKEKGRWRGEQNGRYRTVQGRVRSYFTFNRKGEYQLQISQITGQYDLEGVHSLQMKVEKTKLDYDL